MGGGYHHASPGRNSLLSARTLWRCGHGMLLYVGGRLRTLCVEVQENTQGEEVTAYHLYAASPISAHYRVFLCGMGGRLLCVDHMDRLYCACARLVYQCAIVCGYVGLGTKIRGTMAVLDGGRYRVYHPLHPEGYSFQGHSLWTLCSDCHCRLL